MKEEIVISKALDGVELTGILFSETEKKKKVVVSIHGMATNCIKTREIEIAKKVTEIGMDYYTFNNRGHDLVNYIQKGTGRGNLGGTTYEEISECYEDIVGAMKNLINKGYEEFYLMGHSLGSTKLVYTYHQLQEKNENEYLARIRGIILLSLIDIPMAISIYLGENYPAMLTYAKNQERENNGTILMPEQAFIHPISVKTFLRYTRDKQDIDFAQYSNELYSFDELNAIKTPLFMRWGTVRELIAQKPDQLVKQLTDKISNSSLDINFIEGADHSYTGKEEQLASEIQNFLRKQQ